MLVNTDAIRTTAEEIEALNTSLDNAFSSVKTSMDSVKNTWSGAASEKAYSIFVSIKDNHIEAQRTAVCDYVNFLKQFVATGYETVETENIRLSDQFK